MEVRCGMTVERGMLGPPAYVQRWIDVERSEKVLGG